MIMKDLNIPLEFSSNFCSNFVFPFVFDQRQHRVFHYHIPPYARMTVSIGILITARN